MQQPGVHCERPCMQTKPVDLYLYEPIERNMDEDFQVRIQMPGSAPVQVSARAWLELRSRVQGFPTPVRLHWGVAGILDALLSGANAETRARAALLLAAKNQLSIDRGSWIVAGEIPLEDPLAAFSAHSLPTESEVPYTKLIDGRWFNLRSSTTTTSVPVGQATASGKLAEKEVPKPDAKTKGKGIGAPKPLFTHGGF